MSTQLTLQDVLSEIKASCAELIGFSTDEGTDLFWPEDIKLSSDRIEGDCFDGCTHKSFSYDSINEVHGVIMDVDVDEYGSASYCDFAKIISFNRIPGLPLKFEETFRDPIYLEQ